VRGISVDSGQPLSRHGVEGGRSGLVWPGQPEAIGCTHVRSAIAVGEAGAAEVGTGWVRKK
jgi:hypothetical protein